MSSSPGSDSSPVLRASGKSLYLDCSSGIAGDMIVAALLDAGGDWEDLGARLRSLTLPGAKWSLDVVNKKGFAAKKFNVTFPPQHAHRHLSDIQKIIDESDIGAAASELAMRMFVELGHAEASVHGTDLKKVHFHEVGAIDSIIDIVGIAILLDQLQIESVRCSPVCTGFGTIEIAHGQVAVPAPATALLLNGFPIFAGTEEGEMVTPTGAAFLATFAQAVDGMPSMKLDAVGTGAGTKDLDSRANVIRVYLGESQSTEVENKYSSEELLEMQFQVDDMTGQQLGYLQGLLIKSGVNDCFLTAIQMKKGRPGTLVTLQCAVEARRAIEAVIFQHSTTIGIRMHKVQRSVLKRETAEIDSELGSLVAKTVFSPSGEAVTRPEFDEVVRVAETTGRSVIEVQQQLGASGNSNSPE